MKHQNVEVGFKLRMLVNDIAEAATSFNSGQSNGLGGNINMANNLVTMVVAAAVGSRNFPVSAFSSADGHTAAETTQHEAVLSLISEIGTITFINQQEALKLSRAIFSSRWNTYNCPVLAMADMNLCTFISESGNGESSGKFTAMWLERALAVFNEYVDTYYTE